MGPGEERRQILIFGIRISSFSLVEILLNNLDMSIKKGSKTESISAHST